MTDFKLNKEQLEAIKHQGGPLLIIAGAGTGKTTVITERIKHLIVSEVAKPSEILALAFTEKASREMEERVDIAVPYGYTQMWISTFHAFCDRVLRAEALNIGLPTNYKLLTQAEATQLLRNNLFSFELNYYRPLGNPNKFVAGMLQHFSRLQDEDVAPFDYIKWASAKFKVQSSKLDKEEMGKYLELAQAYQKYQELKVKEGVMDFGDLIVNTLLLFRKRPAILKNYQEQFKYILVDEFQDTNIAQYDLLRLLAPPGKKSNLTVVGDDSQSIYKFRGAAVSNILQFMHEYKNAKQVVLTDNYRSTQTILDSAYKLIRNNDPDTLEAKLGISKKLTKVRRVHETEVGFIYKDRVENEADAVAKEISHPITYRDFAILVRANAQAEPFVRALARAGIPYQFLGPGQLFRQEEVKDLIAYLKVLYNFEDSAALYRVLSMEHFDIAARDLAAILNYRRRFNFSLFEACEEIDDVFVTDSTKDKIKKFVQMVLRHLKLVKRETAGQILYYFLEDSGILAKLGKPEDAKDERRAQNISRFFEKLKTYEVGHEDATVFAVVDWLELSMELGESPLASDTDWSDINAVNILTVHSSKGLEFPVVFLVNLVAGRFPTYERREQIPIPEELIKEELPTGDYHLEEERRLFYVGMTRAMDRLYLTAANYYGEGKRERKPSPFVAEALGEKVSRVKSLESSEQLSIFDYAPVVAPITSHQSPVTPIPINYISYSQIAEFKVCPLHYKLKYIIGIPMPASAAQSFGTTMHKTLADFYSGLKNGAKGTIDQLLKIYDSSWNSEGYSSKSHENLMKKRGKNYLESYFKKEFDRKHLPILLEYPFSFRVGNLKVGGRIDRVDKNAKGIEVIDYKTGNVIPEKELAKNLQLTVYALAATEVKEAPFARKPEEVSLSLYFFEGDKKLTTTRTAAALEDAKEEILKTVEEIASSNFECSHSVLCQTCEYKMFCGTIN